jgi:argininosuccinate lyase
VAADPISHDKFPAPEYARTVLAVNFADAQKQFLDALLAIEVAHGVMLHEQGMLSRDEARAIFSGLAGLDRQALLAAKFDGSVEDFFFYVERDLAQLCPPEIAGPNVSGKLHTARSRNDIAITLYRMRIREELLTLHGRIAKAIETLLALANQHRDTVMPAHTHTQPAQPSTLAHYLAAATECFERDLTRIEHAWSTVNRSPMGSCAITTTGFPISRDRVAELLGFEGLQLNSYGAIAATDYVGESIAALMVSAVNLGKVVQDLLLWGTAEFGFISLSDAFVQVSSIMPQKRNPVSIEHTRILASRTVGESQAVITAMHNTPFGDIVDSEDDLLPLVFLAFEDGGRAWDLFAAAAGSIRVDKAKLAAEAGKRFLTVTELADTLVRKEAISFHDAHALVSAAVNADRTSDSHERLISDLQRLAPQILGRPLSIAPADLKQALDPVYFVQTRNIPGGPGAAAINAQLALTGDRLIGHRQWSAGKQAVLDTARDERTRLQASLA